MKTIILLIFFQLVVIFYRQSKQEFLGNTGTDRVHILGPSVEGAGITSIETVGGKYPSAKGPYGNVAPHFPVVEQTQIDRIGVLHPAILVISPHVGSDNPPPPVHLQALH